MRITFIGENENVASIPLDVLELRMRTLLGKRYHCEPLAVTSTDEFRT